MSDVEMLRITAIPTAIPNGATKDIRFQLDIENSEPLALVANYNIATQIASTLGAAIDLLRIVLAAENAVVQVNATEIREIRFHKAMLGDALVIELINTLGIPYAFQFPAQKAEEFAERLMAEAHKDHPAGRA